MPSVMQTISGISASMALDDRVRGARRRHIDHRWRWHRSASLRLGNRGEHRQHAEPSRPLVQVSPAFSGSQAAHHLGAEEREAPARCKTFRFCRSAPAPGLGCSCRARMDIALPSLRGAGPSSRLISKQRAVGERGKGHTLAAVRRLPRAVADVVDRLVVAAHAADRGKRREVDLTCGSVTLPLQ